MSDLLIQPFAAPFKVTMSPPGSKSLTNRAMVLAALGDGASTLSNVLFADDTLVMIDGLRKLGFQLDVDETQRAVVVHGQGGVVPNSEAELFCGNSGTTIRFLTALAALGKGKFTLDGVERMRQRPIAALTGLLAQLGVKTQHAAESEGFPPVQVHADGVAGGTISYGSEVSSQYLSAILMIAPYAKDEVRIELKGEQTSWPYIVMTMRLMDEFGITPELERDKETGEPKKIFVPQGKYHPTNYSVEPDASNATYFLAAAAVRKDAKVTIEGLGKRSLQGDVGFADVLHQMGASLVFGKDFITITGTGELNGIDTDFSAMPDAAMTLATVATLAKSRTTIRGLHTLRVKETDRLAALQAELTKVGATVAIEEDALVIDPPKQIKPASIDTYDDHRMAMSFAVIGTVAEGVTIKDVQCVNKTYPNFFKDLHRLAE